MSQEDLTPLQCSGRISMAVSSGRMLHDLMQDCHIDIDPDGLKVRCPLSRLDISYSWRNILSLQVQDYAITLNPLDQPPFVLSHLGFQFDNCLRMMRRFRNIQLAQDLLFSEKLEVIYRSFLICYHKQNNSYEIKGDVHCTATGLIFLLQDGDPFRIALADIVSIKPENFEISITLEDDVHLLLSRLGSQQDAMVRDIRQLIQRLEDQTRQLLSSFWPNAPTVEMNAAVRLLADGRAATKTELILACPALWPHLENKLAQSPIASEYRFFADLGPQDMLGVGLKRGLWGDPQSEYLWLVMAFPKQNRLVYEASLITENTSQDSDEPGKASYFFKIPADLRPLNEAADFQLCLNRFNRALRAINFRREPIYLSQEQLGTIHFERYVHAIHKIPELRVLREQFVGRVIHRSEKQWQGDCLALINQEVQASVPQGEL